MYKTLVQIYACKNLHDRNLRSSAILRGGDWQLPTFRDPSHRRVTSQKSKGLVNRGGILNLRVALSIFSYILTRYRDIHVSYVWVETPHSVPLQQKVAAISLTSHSERITGIVKMDIH